MIGLYPLTGQTTFLILAPWFESMTLTLPNDKTLEITTSGGDHRTTFYIQSLTINGVPWDKSWVSWEDIFENGGTMHYVLGNTPTRWNLGELPPSPASSVVDNA